MRPDVGGLGSAGMRGRWAPVGAVLLVAGLAGCSADGTIVAARLPAGTSPVPAVSSVPSAAPVSAPPSTAPPPARLPAAGNPDGRAAVPAEARAEDTSRPS